MTVIRNGWKLTGVVRWEPVKYDERIVCPQCRGSGKTIHFGVSEDDNYSCPECSGNGFYYTRWERGEAPEVPKALAKYLADAYKEWMEMYEHTI